MTQHIQTVSSVRCQIERVVRRTPGLPVGAEFLRNGEWFCCQAWIISGNPFIQARGNSMTPEEAAIVAVAIQMALDWLAEEISKRGS